MNQHQHQHLTEEAKIAQAAQRTWFTPMTGRNPHEHPRVATTLELLFDLIFVVAIALAGAQLHHAIAQNHIFHGVLNYVMVFFAIWWAWMGFTWFGSAFDTDDVLYRVALLVQMAGAIVIAAGVGSAFEGNFLVMTIGYCILRVVGVAQWFRVAHQSPRHKKVATRYGIGILMSQLGWVALLFAPKSWGVVPFFAMLVVEFAVPMWAERAGGTDWHPHHIAERFGLLTIIVLGESILAAVTAINKGVDAGLLNTNFILFCIGALLVVFCMWWIYFEDEVADNLKNYKVVFYWSYGHYFIFAAAAAAGAGLAAQVDQRMGLTQISDVVAAYGLAVPVALFVFMTWLIHKRVGQADAVWIMPVAAGVILLTPWVTGLSTLLIGLVLSVAIGLRLELLRRQAK